MAEDTDKFSFNKQIEHSLRTSLIDLSRSTKRRIMRTSDTLGFLGCTVMAAWVDAFSAAASREAVVLGLVTLSVAYLLARHLGFYRSIVRYLGIGLLFAGTKVATGSAIVLGATAYWLGMTSHPIRLATVYWAFSCLYIVGSRYLAQYFLIHRSSKKDNVVIYGAGEAGIHVSHALQGHAGYKPIAFVDDDPDISGKQIDGLLVYPTSDLESLIRTHNISRILLALPSISRARRQKIIEELEAIKVRVQSVPNFDDLISGRARVDEFRDIEVDDLLPRPQVTPDDSQSHVGVKGKSVMVTGAGGSIGSELCRQIVVACPKQIILFELSEVALYSIDRDIRALMEKFDIDCEVVSLLGSVQDADRVSEVMKHFKVQTVFHAAAYKHVPIVEQNIIEGVSNNVFGTWLTAQAAIASGVDTFVLVSTDKAVNPSNVMGASKRFAELTLQALQTTTETTRFAMVRFGNVLESSGSVVPLFREQIMNGGPVTVTHREIIRYFMTIPEAASLVIQAGDMATDGGVFLLDMGEPVKIYDLAIRMIHLMGLTVKSEENTGGDIEINVTGLRPAEKLYEELLIGDNATGTDHPRIMRATEDFIPYAELEPLLNELLVAISDKDSAKVKEILIRAVKEYEPKNGVEDLVWNKSRAPVVASDGSVLRIVPSTL